jgi:hypothetical protein
LEELAWTEGVAAPEQSEDSYEENASGGSDSDVVLATTVRKFEKRAGNGIGGVLHLQEDNTQVIAKKEREG